LTLDNQTTEYFFNCLIEIYSNEIEVNRRKLADFRNLYNEFLKLLTKDEPQIFSSNFARAVFVFDKFEIDETFTKILDKFRLITRTLSSINNSISQANLDYCFYSLSNLFSLFSYDNSIPENIREILSHFNLDEKPIEISDLSTERDFLRVTVKGKNENLLFCEKAGGKVIKVQLLRRWAEMQKIVWKGAILHLIDFEEKEVKNLKVLTNNENSLMVLEPDFTMDVTDISGCFSQNGPSLLIYFLKKMTQSDTSMKLLLGNVVNFCLDELLCNPDADFEKTYYKALSYKPLQVFALATKNKHEVGLLKNFAKTHFDNLKVILPKINTGEISIEPSFMSNKFGLQGRLDVMIEFPDDKHRKNIIELKSGSAPNVSMTVKMPGNTHIRTGLWNENFAQTICYNLLLDSTFESRTGSTQILYSADSASPLRDAPNIIQKKQEIMLFRNMVIAEEHSIMKNDYNIFNRIKPESFNSLPDFQFKSVTSFHDCYSSCTEVERKYFNHFFCFILGENYTSRLGSDNGKDNSGVSSLWKDSLEEKSTSMNIVSGLVLDFDESDFDNYHLVFNRSNPEEISSFRKGDLIILYPINSKGGSNLLKNQLIKCHIIEIDEHKVTISLRNKLFRKRFLEEFENWVIEPDYIDSTNRILQSFSYFLRASDRKRKLILGVSEPEFRKKTDVIAPDLNEKQNYILRQAIAAEDYFIIQGPPGTGKTSYMLREIVNQIFLTTDENILILAYTNRAVDEICSSLKRISTDFPFLRLGNKESSEHTGNLISCLAETMDFKELFKKISGTRIVVSTVTSAITNPEIFEIKHFNTAVIDEASQILEPYLAGLLFRVDRFIMIGDEKQLPAIVLQSENKLKVKDVQLNSIGLNNLGISLFDRLLKMCRHNEWHFAYGMLNEQARMHQQIQSLANNLFYNDKLSTINLWQNTTDALFQFTEKNRFDQILSLSRTIFITSENERKNKVNNSEAKIVSELVKRIKLLSGTDFYESTIGIISPFRAQCAEIIKALPNDLRKLVSVDTIERFQGSERDIIIISFAVNHTFLLNNIQSLSEIDGRDVDRKLNVAITRAKKQLIMLGNPSVLASSPIFTKLLFLIRQNGGYVENVNFS